MNYGEPSIVSAILESKRSGWIELSADWVFDGYPDFRLAEEPHEFGEIHQIPDFEFGREAGFFVNMKGQLVFCLDPRRHPEFDPAEDTLYVVGTFNEWKSGEKWRLKAERLDGHDVMLWRGPAEGMLTEPQQIFKFVTGKGTWIEVPHNAPNVVFDVFNNRNRAISTKRTGRHRFFFGLARPLDLSLEHAVILKFEDHEHRVDLQPGKFFYDLKTDLPLGSIVEEGRTTFRLFAPRASEVKVGFFRELSQGESIEWEAMDRLEDGAWELRVEENLHGFYYWYRVAGPNGPFSHFDPGFNIVDPYAFALVARAGPGIVLEKSRLLDRRRDSFATPQYQDLVVVEAHVRDLLAKSPVVIDPEKKKTFSGLVDWVNHRNCYIKKLGVNAIELLPVQECESDSRDEYHWGYMPVNYFAPESTYGRDPERASQVTELQEAVDAFHRNGFAVILDVVYNHVGEPNHLFLIDKLYYFEIKPDGSVSNWSGCGNDLRCGAHMSRRLIIDSLVHLIECYDVDGFRFDLAELIGVDVLEEVEAALKKVKPDVILIAEPWSFRGHIGAALRDTGYASWNDGYRNFLRGYVSAVESGDAAAYFLRGSPWHFAKWPSQTVNYVESHDDMVWIDIITENPGHDGRKPTADDIRRSHLMIAFLMASVGMPMVHAGQDFLASKHGVNNTYQRGDLNALDYRRMHRFPGTHAYCAEWIRFRRGHWGQLIRQFTRPPDGFLEVNTLRDSNAIAAVYNATGSHGPMRLLFCINPHRDDVVIPIGVSAAHPWQKIADHERFFPPDEVGDELITDAGVIVPGLGCGLWIAGG